MNWGDFEKHPNVIATSESVDKSVDQFLFGVLLHDMIAFLNGYKEWVKLLDSLAIGKPSIRIEGPIPSVPNDVQAWYSKWNSGVENWLSELFDLQKKFVLQNPPEETNWQELISKLSTIPAQISQQYAETQQLTIPSEELPRTFTEKAIGNIEFVNRICRQIEDEEYLTLWNVAIEAKED